MNNIVDGFYPRVSLAFARYSVSHLITFLRNLIAMITGNPAYTNPTPTMVAFTAAVDDLEEKAQAAMNRGRMEVSERRAALRIVLRLARQLASFVQTNCNNDLVTLQSSGFNAIKARSPSVVPGTPTNPRLDYNGLSGTLIFRFGGDSNARNFSVQHAENPDGPWTDDGLSTTTRVRIEELTPGKMCWARSRANGSAGSSDWTVPTCKMAV